jgi:hypothetical protein
MHWNEYGSGKLKDASKSLETGPVNSRRPISKTTHCYNFQFKSVTEEPSIEGSLVCMRLITISLLSDPEPAGLNPAFFFPVVFMIKFNHSYYLFKVNK